MISLMNSIYTANAGAQAMEATTGNPKPELCAKNIIDKARYVSSENRVKEYTGSSAFRSCNNLSLNNIETLYKGGTRRGDFDWEPYIAKVCCSEDAKEKDFNKCEKENKQLAEKCESMAYILSKFDRDWTLEDHFKEDKIESSPRMPTSGVNGGAATAVLGSSSIKCQSAGMETVDYEDCKNFVSTLETFNVVQATGYQVQDLTYKVKASDLSTKYMNEQNAATGALKTQSDSLKMQEDIYQQRTAVDIAKLGLLYKIFQNIPTYQTIKEKCSTIPHSSDKSGISITPEVCYSTVNKGGFSFMMNEKYHDAMKIKLVEIATQAGSSAILASLMGKRAGDVDNAIAKIEDFKPIDPVIVSEDDARSTFCNLNPGHANCLTAGLNRTFDTIDGNIINFGGSGLGTNYDSKINTNDVVSSGGSDSSSASGNNVTPVGSVITAAAKDNTIEGSSAANVKTSGIGSSGGGGGGGGGRSAGGGGGGAPNAGDKGGVQAAVPGAVPKYEGGGISVVGGMGIRGTKKDNATDENPFGKLFGKDAPKNAGVVNFREVASVGRKGDNIFDMISKRYSSVSADKRLLEYELAK